MEKNNRILSEREIQERINFKFDQFLEYLNNMIANTRHHHINEVHPKYGYYAEAFEGIRTAFLKERSMPVPWDEIAEKKIRGDNERFTNKLSQRLLKRGERNYYPNERFIRETVAEIMNTATFIAYDEKKEIIQNEIDKRGFQDIASFKPMITRPE